MDIELHSFGAKRVGSSSLLSLYKKHAGDVVSHDPDALVFDEGGGIGGKRCTLLGVLEGLSVKKLR